MSTRLLLGFFIASVLGLGSACSQNVIVRSDRERVDIVVGPIEGDPAALEKAPTQSKSDRAVDDEGAGPRRIEISQKGTQVVIKPGMRDVPITIFDDGRIRQGFVPRSRPDPWLVSTAVAGACCCVPTGIFAGACLVNPGTWAAGVGACLTLNPGVLFAATPTVLTPYAMAIGGAAGLSPILLGTLGKTEDVIDIRVSEVPFVDAPADVQSY